MVIGTRLRNLRVERDLSQADLGSRTGLLQCYISRIEQGHTVPSLETLEKFAQALGVPLHQLFYDQGGSLPTPHLTPRSPLEELPEEDGSAGREARFLLQIRKLVGRMAQSNRQLLLDVAVKLAARQNASKSI